MSPSEEADGAVTNAEPLVDAGVLGVDYVARIRELGGSSSAMARTAPRAGDRGKLRCQPRTNPTDPKASCSPSNHSGTTPGSKDSAHSQSNIPAPLQLRISDPNFRRHL